MLEIFKYNAIRDMFKLNITAKELETIFKDYKKNKAISPQYKKQADEIAKVISNKLELNHSAEEWLNALDKMF
jgi:hypothetical protein